MEDKKESFNANYLIVCLVLLILVFSVIQSFQISSIKKNFSGVGMMEEGGGETYEEMMERMHPEQAGNKVSSSPTMVGVC